MGSRRASLAEEGEVGDEDEKSNFNYRESGGHINSGGHSSRHYPAKSRGVQQQVRGGGQYESENSRDYYSSSRYPPSGPRGGSRSGDPYYRDFDSYGSRGRSFSQPYRVEGEGRPSYNSRDYDGGVERDRDYRRDERGQRYYNYDDRPPYEYGSHQRKPDYPDQDYSGIPPPYYRGGSEERAASRDASKYHHQTQTQRVAFLSSSSREALPPAPSRDYQHHGRDRDLDHRHHKDSRPNNDRRDAPSSSRPQTNYHSSRGVIPSPLVTQSISVPSPAVPLTASHNLLPHQKTLTNNAANSSAVVSSSTSIHTALPPRDPLDMELSRLQADELKLRLELKRIEYDESRAARDVEKFEAMISGLEGMIHDIDKVTGEEGVPSIKIKARIAQI